MIETLPKTNSNTTHRALGAMGCVFEIVLHDPLIASDNPYHLASVAEEIESLIADWHDRLTVFSPTSIISRFNDTPANTPFKVDPDLFELLALADKIRDLSDNTFNIAAGTLMHAHGHRPAQPPTNSNLNNLQLNNALTLNPSTSTITKTDSRIQLDLGAIAKGFVLDQIKHILDEHEITNAFIHGGTSSILALGTSPHNTPWTIKLPTHTTLPLTNQSAAISDPAPKHPSNTAVSHLMDPSCNTPVSSTITNTWCTSPSATFADAFSTIIAINPAKARAIASTLAITAWGYTDDQGTHHTFDTQQLHPSQRSTHNV